MSDELTERYRTGEVKREKIINLIAFHNLRSGSCTGCQSNISNLPAKKTVELGNCSYAVNKANELVREQPSFYKEQSSHTYQISNRLAELSRAIAELARRRHYLEELEEMGKLGGNANH